jgi:hypothetical protein
MVLPQTPRHGGLYTHAAAQANEISLIITLEALIEYYASDP